MASKKTSSTSFRFRAKVVRTDHFCSVDLPARVSRAIGVRGTVRVIGSVEGAPVRTSLIPVKGGRHRLWLNRQVRAAAGALPGGRVTVELRVDDAPPREVTPEDLAESLREEGVFEAFETMAPGRRNHIIRWVEQAVHETTRAKRLARCVELALALHERRVDRQAKALARRIR